MGSLAKSFDILRIGIRDHGDEPNRKSVSDRGIYRGMTRI